MQENWSREKTCSSMEISPLETSLSTPNGSSSKEDVVNILLAGVTRGRTSDLSKTRIEKEGEMNGGKNHHPSNEKIGGASSARTTGERSPETIRMEFDTTVMSESPQESPTTRTTNWQANEGNVPLQNTIHQAESWSPPRYRQSDSEKLLSAIKPATLPLTTETVGPNSTSSRSTPSFPWTDDVRKPSTQHRLASTQPLTLV
jgi:hypothetical protein